MDYLGSTSNRGKTSIANSCYLCVLTRLAQIALAFLNDTCASTHGNLTIDSVFLAPSGEWRLGGFELLSTTKDDNPVLFVGILFCRFSIIY